MGLVDDRAWDRFNRRQEALRLGAQARGEDSHFRRKRSARSAFPREARLPTPCAGRASSLATLPIASIPALDEEIGERLAIELKCEGYVRRQELAIEKAAKTENATIPADFDYQSIAALSAEAREKFTVAAPADARNGRTNSRDNALRRRDRRPLRP